MPFGKILAKLGVFTRILISSNIFAVLIQFERNLSSFLIKSTAIPTTIDLTTLE